MLRLSTIIIRHVVGLTKDKNNRYSLLVDDTPLPKCGKAMEIVFGHMNIATHISAKIKLCQNIRQEIIGKDRRFLQRRPFFLKSDSLCGKKYLLLNLNLNLNSLRDILRRFAVLCCFDPSASVLYQILSPQNTLLTL